MREHMSIVEIIDALKQLDPDNDAHWTEEGFPRLDVMQELMLGVTREQIRAAAPKFSRRSPDQIPDYQSVRDEKLKAVKAAELAVVEAQQALRDAKNEYMKAEQPFIQHPDPWQGERQMRKWLKGQETVALQRHQRGKYIDSLVADAGGPRQIGPHPIDVGLAARGKAARKARQNVTIKTNG